MERKLSWKNTRKRYLRRITPGRIAQYIYIYLITIIVLFPVLNIFVSAFKTNTEILRSTMLPAPLYLGNFQKVFQQKYLYSGFLNSIVITVCSLFISTILSMLAAYPLSRNDGRVYKFIYFFFISAQLIPSVTNLIPLYQLLKNLHLMDTRIGMILLYGSQMVMGILLFTSFIKTIPRVMTEAAEIDGCNYLQAFFYVVFPMLKPVTVTYIMVRVLSIWNDFLWPQLFLPSREKQTITLVVFAYQNESAGNDWGAIFALMALSSLPPILFFILNQKYFFENMSLGAIKG
ncbi:MAG TPA: carbohydrate ABC transporter permease [Candidatus Eisenbergiella merdipullorum]|uniref:Carbohydrate ABC transporter permease n=1 Tax=Candidatus Eisenbergiella merdipullorum TaxID=2838553 RepID=A0A9D2IAJ0_9FIRM|nr:carbohydrate ABC transporter permease [Candidatus Eisenbergiella merdipullorum]